MKHNFLKFYPAELKIFLPKYFLLDNKTVKIFEDPLLGDTRLQLDTYWSAKNIRYDLNEYDFRTHHNFNSLNDGEFIIATGCSHTFGLGIDENSRWSNQLEKMLGTPVVNLGVVGSDITCVIRNVSAFISSYSKPKAILIQVPETTRFSYLTSDGISKCRSYFYVKEFAQRLGETVTDLEKNGADFHLNQEVAIHQLILLQTVMSAFRIPIVYFSINTLDLNFHDGRPDSYTKYESTVDGYISNLFPKDIIYNFDASNPSIDFKKYDGVLMTRARDLFHCGDSQNLVWAEKLIEILNFKF